MNLGKETETVEFKKTTNELKEAMKSISSILNKHGVGTIYFGVDRNGEVVGQMISESTLRDVSRAIYESIKPQIYPVIEEVVYQGRHVIRVECSGEAKPYSAYGKYYMRTADEDREVSPEKMKALFSADRSRDEWESSPSKANQEQIDKKAIRAFCKNATSSGRLAKGRYSSLTILKRFGLLEGRHLTNAGEHLFGSTRPVSVKAACFASEEKLTFLDMKLFEDNIYNLLRICEDYILKNIRWEGRIEGMKRVDVPEIPLAVIREVLANGFAHASYTSRSTHEICIHPGMISVYSPGEYVSRFSPEEYIRGNVESEIRNPSIAKILYLDNSIEQFGSGFKRIHSLCLEHGVRYGYESKENGFKFILYRQRGRGDLPLNELEASILALLRQNNAYSREELSKKSFKSIRSIQRALNALREKGYIKRKGRKKDSAWEILG